MTWSPFEDGAAAPLREIWLPTKLPGETINQTFDTATLKPPISIATATQIAVQVAPSGAGELTIPTLTSSGTTVTFEETAGVGGRVYTLLFSATLADGEILQWLLSQGCQNLPPFPDPPPPPSSGFGSPTTWTP